MRSPAKRHYAGSIPAWRSIVVNSVNKAEAIVHILLDDEGIIRACSWCEKEFGRRTPGANVSHGVCKRHLAQQWRSMGYEDKARQIEQRSDSEFPPDLAMQSQAAAPAKGCFWPTGGSLS